MGDKLDALAAWLCQHRWDIVYRCAVAVLLAAWLRLFPMYLLTLYLAQEGNSAA